VGSTQKCSRQTDQSNCILPFWLSCKAREEGRLVAGCNPNWIKSKIMVASQLHT